MSDSFLTDYLQTRQRVDQLERIESGGGGGGGSGTYLTLNRTNGLVISTSGTTVTWENEVRSSGMSWSGSQITMPSDGYYVIDMAFELSGSVTSYRVNVLVNGTTVGTFATDIAANRIRAVAARWFSASSYLEVTVSVSSSRIMQVAAYDTSYESPFIHVVRIA